MAVAYSTHRTQSTGCQAEPCPASVPPIPPLPPPSCPLPLRACPCPSPSDSLFLATACAPSNSRPLQTSPLLHTRIQYLFVRFAGSCSSGGTAAWPEAQEGQLSALALRRRGALVFRAEYFFRSVWGPAVVGKAVATVRPRLLPRLALAETVHALRRSTLACRALPCPIRRHPKWRPGGQPVHSKGTDPPVEPLCVQCAAGGVRRQSRPRRENTNSAGTRLRPFGVPCAVERIR